MTFGDAAGVLLLLLASSALVSGRSKLGGAAANNLNERLNTYKEYMTNPYQKTIDSYESTNACAGD